TLQVNRNLRPMSNSDERRAASTTRAMNHPSVAHPAKDKKKKKVGRTKESARKHEGPLIPKGAFPYPHRVYLYPLSRKGARYRPRTLFLLQPLNCCLVFPLRLRIPYPHDPESSL